MNERADRANRCGDNFRTINSYLRAADAEEWTTLHLSMAQLRVLFRLYFEGPLTVGRLANSLGVTLPSITGTVDRLVQQELVERRMEPADRRLVINQLTPAGHALIDRLHQGRRARLQTLLNRLSPAELAAVDEALALMAGHASAARAIETAESGTTGATSPADKPGHIKTKAGA